MCYKSYLGCLTGLLLLRVNLSGPPFPWQLPAILPFAGLSYSPLGRLFWVLMVDAHGLPKLELHSAPSLPPADLVCPALPCSLCRGMHAGNWATSPLLTPLEWACLENNTHLAGLIPKQVTNKLNNLSSHSSAFFFLHFSLYPPLPRSVSIHTFQITSTYL